jgi:hypothetical protein
VDQSQKIGEHETSESAPWGRLVGGCLLIIAALVLTPIACAVVSLFVAVTVNVANVDPTEPLRDLVISGCGQVHRVALLESGQSVSVRIHGDAECSVELSFQRADGQLRKVPAHGYIEGDYIGIMVFKVDRAGLQQFESDVHSWWEPQNKGMKQTKSTPRHTSGVAFAAYAQRCADMREAHEDHGA